MKLIAVLILVVMAQSVYGESVGTNYYCREEFGGGLGFVDKNVGWRGVIFSAKDAFVVHIEDPGTTTSGGRAKEARRVTVTKEGDNQTSQCIDPTQDSMNDMERIPLLKGILRCTAVVTDFQFNIQNNRFMKIYPYGYVNGANDNDDTPSITGGRCTKIN